MISRLGPNKIKLSTLFKQSSGDAFDMRELAVRICRDYLHGAWKKVNTKNINFKQIRWVFLSSMLLYLTNEMKHQYGDRNPKLWGETFQHFNLKHPSMFLKINVLCIIFDLKKYYTGCFILDFSNNNWRNFCRRYIITLTFK